MSGKASEFVLSESERSGKCKKPGLGVSKVQANVTTGGSNKMQNFCQGFGRLYC